MDIFERLDVNKDGKVNVEDLKLIVVKMFDKNGDGKVSISEALAGMTKISVALSDLQKQLKKA